MTTSITDSPTIQRFLHVGCGHNQKNRTTRGFNTPQWQEIRFDIDAAVSPDVVGTMQDMSAVGDASVEAIYSSHNIEHLYAHEVGLALKEFLRVLVPAGFLVVTCPDMRSVCALIGNDQLLEPAYNSPAGPISPIDILYGHRPSLARGNHYMAHRCGFTEKVLSATLQQAGFASVASMTRGQAPFFDLWAIGAKQKTHEQSLRALAAMHFPV